ncbi:MAG: Rho termination factor N-terminal domain-containing protein [Solirubrobacteraceae bacterium]
MLDRSALEASPLADLHAIASEIGLDSYRRLRKADLVDAILARQDGGEAPVPPGDGDGDGEAAEAGGAEEPSPAAAEPGGDEEEDAEPARPRRRRGGRGRGRGRDEREEPSGGEQQAAEHVDGELDVLPNGSGFVRVDPPEHSDGDVYVSAAQIRRCELAGGNRVSGPVRAPRRSERHPSLVRVETIDGVPAEDATPARFDDLQATFPDRQIELGKDDDTLHLVDRVAPFGRGSRVLVVGGARAGKSELLRALAERLAADADLEPSLALAGVRPEEVPGWGASPTPPVQAATIADSAETQGHAVDRALEAARRTAARGGHAVLLVDTLEGLHAPAARKVLAAARNVPDGGSLTVIATAAKPYGGETTVIALDAARAAARRFPAVDVALSGTVRADLLVGEKGLKAIAKAHADAAKAK